MLTIGNKYLEIFKQLCTNVVLDENKFWTICANFAIAVPSNSKTQTQHCPDSAFLVTFTRIYFFCDSKRIYLQGIFHKIATETLEVCKGDMK